MLGFSRLTTSAGDEDVPVIVASSGCYVTGTSQPTPLTEASPGDSLASAARVRRVATWGGDALGLGRARDMRAPRQPPGEA